MERCVPLDVRYGWSRAKQQCLQAHVNVSKRLPPHRATALHAPTYTSHSSTSIHSLVLVETIAQFNSIAFKSSHRCIGHLQQKDTLKVVVTLSAIQKSNRRLIQPKHPNHTIKASKVIYIDTTFHYKIRIRYNERHQKYDYVYSINLK